MASPGQRSRRLRHPFEWLPASGQKKAFISLAIITLTVLASLQLLNGHIRTEAAPTGILSFELAGGMARAQHIVESWGQRERIYAGLSLGLDYLFLVLYAITISLGCVLVGARLSGEIKYVGKWGIVLAWGQLTAGFLDGVENYALIQVLLGSDQRLWPEVAWLCAVPKFLIVAFGLIYIVIGGAVVATRGRRG